MTFESQPQLKEDHVLLPTKIRVHWRQQGETRRDLEETEKTPNRRWEKPRRQRKKA